MTTTQAPRRPPGRYDEPRGLSRPVLVAGGALLAVLLGAVAVVGYAYYAKSRTPYVLLGYRVVSDTEVQLTFEVTKDRGEKVECSVQARDRINADVGDLTVTFTPVEAGTVTKTVSIPTSARAGGAEVLSCRPTT